MRMSVYICFLFDVYYVAIRYKRQSQSLLKRVNRTTRASKSGTPVAKSAISKLLSGWLLELHEQAEPGRTGLPGWILPPLVEYYFFREISYICNFCLESLARPASHR